MPTCPAPQPGPFFEREAAKMKKLFPRKRLAMGFGVLGIALMGVDLMMTRNFFTHIGELMAASIICFVLAIVLDRTPKGAEKST